jgi:hypothetical protein
MQTPRPQINLPTETPPQKPVTHPYTLMSPSRFVPLPKRKVYVDAEEMSWYIEQISISLSPHKSITRSDSVWPTAFLYKV